MRLRLRLWFINNLLFLGANLVTVVNLKRMQSKLNTCTRKAFTRYSAAKLSKMKMEIFGISTLLTRESQD